eukprot:GHVU01192894.1.p1 GENE.GHVU01192894.1~~GHVU01192894.1.p1  ORF type:complete len:262 (-),score=25.79 GHVU01192894.1:430-1215(-)
MSRKVDGPTIPRAGTIPQPLPATPAEAAAAATRRRGTTIVSAHPPAHCLPACLTHSYHAGTHWPASFPSAWLIESPTTNSRTLDVDCDECRVEADADGHVVDKVSLQIRDQFPQGDEVEVQRLPGDLRDLRQAFSSGSHEQVRLWPVEQREHNSDRRQSGDAQLKRPFTSRALCPSPSPQLVFRGNPNSPDSAAQLTSSPPSPDTDCTTAEPPIPNNSKQRKVNNYGVTAIGDDSDAQRRSVAEQGRPKAGLGFDLRLPGS